MDSIIRQSGSCRVEKAWKYLEKTEVDFQLQNELVSAEITKAYPYHR